MRHAQFVQEDGAYLQTGECGTHDSAGAKFCKFTKDPIEGSALQANAAAGNSKVEKRRESAARQLPG